MNLTEVIALSSPFQVEMAAQEEVRVGGVAAVSESLTSILGGCPWGLSSSAPGNCFSLGEALDFPVHPVVSFKDQELNVSDRVK